MAKARAVVLKVAGRVRAEADPIHELSSKHQESLRAQSQQIQESSPLLRRAHGRRTVTMVRRRPGAPPGSALFSECSCLRLRRCRRGRPGLALRACRQRAPRCSRPPGPARAAAAARPPPPARPGRPSRVRGASGQRARRRQHAHGRPRARAALGCRPAAGRGAPPASGRAPAEPRRAPRPELHGWEAGGRAGPGRPRLSPSARPRRQGLRAGSEISRPLSAT